jgi:hypothetical protein
MIKETNMLSEKEMRYDLKLRKLAEKYFELSESKEEEENV